MAAVHVTKKSPDKHTRYELVFSSYYQIKRAARLYRGSKEEEEKFSSSTERVTNIVFDKKHTKHFSVFLTFMGWE